MQKSFIFLLSVCSLFLSLAFGTVDFYPKRETYYYYERYNSSAVCSSNVRLALCTGQSVRLEGVEPLELLKEYQATVLKVEKVDGITNYYCHSPLFGRGISIFGEKINLQIAKREDVVLVGTPILFGSF